jgi:hypothetical protein
LFLLLAQIDLSSVAKQCFRISWKSTIAPAVPLACETNLRPISDIKDRICVTVSWRLLELGSHILAHHHEETKLAGAFLIRGGSGRCRLLKSTVWTLGNLKRSWTQNYALQSCILI